MSFVLRRGLSTMVPPKVRLPLLPDVQPDVKRCLPFLTDCLTSSRSFDTVLFYDAYDYCPASNDQHKPFQDAARSDGAHLTD